MVDVSIVVDQKSCMISLAALSSFHLQNGTKYQQDDKADVLNVKVFYLPIGT